MHECKGAKTPMPTNGHLGTNENGKEFDQQVYRSMMALYCIYVHLGQI